MVDVIQYDIFSYGFTPWLALGRQLDGWGVRTAPHHYGRHLGNFVTAHLAAAIQGFTFVEWDEVETPGIDSSAYRVEEGQVVVPNTPGFGLLLDEERFEEAVEQRGYAISLSMA
jgi:L-rhamnonate dehydratase